jgi:hypothetical protein
MEVVQIPRARGNDNLYENLERVRAYTRLRVSPITFAGTPATME